jgi:hypothetical protein
VQRRRWSAQTEDRTEDFAYSLGFYLQKEGKAPLALLLKEGEQYRTVTVDYRDGLRYPRLERHPSDWMRGCWLHVGGSQYPYD